MEATGGERVIVTEYPDINPQTQPEKHMNTTGITSVIKLHPSRITHAIHHPKPHQHRWDKTERKRRRDALIRRVHAYRPDIGEMRIVFGSACNWVGGTAGRPGQMNAGVSLGRRSHIHLSYPIQCSCSWHQGSGPRRNLMDVAMPRQPRLGWFCFIWRGWEEVGSQAKRNTGQQ